MGSEESVGEEGAVGDCGSVKDMGTGIRLRRGIEKEFFCRGLVEEIGFEGRGFWIEEGMRSSLG